MVGLVGDSVLTETERKPVFVPFLRKVFEREFQLGYQLVRPLLLCRDYCDAAVRLEQEPVHEEEQGLRSGAGLSRLFKDDVRLVAADGRELHQGKNLPLVAPGREPDDSVLVLDVGELGKVEDVVLAFKDIAIHNVPRVVIFASRRNCRLAEA